jgi:electron transfer flavoprotein beta subunit
MVVSAQKELTEPRIPNMRGIMAARTKPLNVVEAQGAPATTVLGYEAPKAKAACHYFTTDQMDELVAALHNEAKVI